MEKKVGLLKGYGIAILLFLLLTMTAAALIRFTAIPETMGKLFLLLSMTISCFFIGFYMGRLFEKRGLLSGIFFPLIFIGGILFSASLYFSTPFSPESLSAELLIPSFFGILGGILGANAAG